MSRDQSFTSQFDHACGLFVNLQDLRSKGHCVWNRDKLMSKTYIITSSDQSSTYPSEHVANQETWV